MPMLHGKAGPGALWAARIVVFGFWLVVVGVTPLHRLAHLPDAMFAPPGIFMLLPDAFWAWFADPVVLTVYRAGLAVALLAVVAQRRPHRALLLGCALGVLGYHGFTLGFGGFLNHGRFAPLYVAILLSLVPHPSRQETGRIDEPNPTAASALQLGALLMATAYALIGLHRFFVGGATIFLNDALPAYMMVRTFEPGGYPWELTYALVGSTWILAGMKVGFFVTTVAEALSPIAVFHHRFRWAWLVVIVPFHFVTLFTMNIFFWENLILIALLFTSFPTRVGAYLDGRGRDSRVALEAAVAAR